MTVTKHLNKNLGFLAAYTFSKALGYIDANGPAAYYTSVQDYFNRKLDRSITEFSTPHQFKLTWVYETPFGKGRRWNLGRANPFWEAGSSPASTTTVRGFPFRSRIRDSVFRLGLHPVSGPTRSAPT